MSVFFVRLGLLSLAQARGVGGLQLSAAQTGSAEDRWCLGRDEPNPVVQARDAAGGW